MQTAIRSTLHIVLAFAIATAPIVQNYAYAKVPEKPVTATSQLKMWVSSVTKYFRGTDKDGQTYDAHYTTSVIEGNNEVETTGAALDSLKGPVVVFGVEGQDDAIFDRAQHGLNGANTQFIKIMNRQNASTAALVKEQITNKLDAGRKKIKSLARDHAFRAIVLSFAGNTTGFGFTVWFTNTSLETAAALSAIVFANGVFANMKIKGHEPYAALLNKGGKGFFDVMKNFNTDYNKFFRLFGKDWRMTESVLRRTGMLLTGFGITAVPTALTLGVESGTVLSATAAVLSAGMLFATLRNSWDIPVDVKLEDLYVSGKITYETKKKLMGLKSFGGPIVDNLAISNFSIAGFPVAQVLAYGLAAGGIISIFASEQVGKTFVEGGVQTRRVIESGHTQARVIASRSAEIGLAVANSFGGGKRRVQAKQLADAESVHVVKQCENLLGGDILQFHARSKGWVGKRVADDMN